MEKTEPTIAEIWDVSLKANGKWKDGQYLKESKTRKVAPTAEKPQNHNLNQKPGNQKTMPESLKFSPS